MSSAPRNKAEAAPARRRREEVLDVATGVFATRGFRHADVQVIADAAGVGKGTVYRYFPSKEELFLATVDRAMRRLQAAIDEAAAGQRDPLDKIVAAIRAHLRFFDAEPLLVELFIQERAEFRDRPQPTYFQYRECNEERWRALLEGLIRDGRVRDVPINRIFDVLRDLLYGAIFTNYFTGRRKPMEQQAEDILDIVFHGILTR